jgi:hypothetical protein
MNAPEPSMAKACTEKEMKVEKRKELSETNAPEKSERVRVALRCSHTHRFSYLTHTFSKYASTLSLANPLDVAGRLGNKQRHTCINFLVLAFEESRQIPLPWGPTLQEIDINEIQTAVIS